MFQNVGGKIKTVVKIFAWIEMVSAFFYGLILATSDEDTLGIGLLVMVCGPLAAWISSLFLYGFGELVENSTLLAGKNVAAPPTPSATDAVLEKWRKEGLITEDDCREKAADKAESL